MRLYWRILACAVFMIVMATIPGSGAKPADAAPVDLQPDLPLRAAFYYPWFPGGWRQHGIEPYTRYTPTLGYYDSSDETVIRRHIDAMKYGNIAAGIASWWGQGTTTDGRIPALLAATVGDTFRWSVYYEPEGQGDPDSATLAADLMYLRDRYGADPGFLRIDGRFVVFVYADPLDGCGMVDRWKQANMINAYIVLKVFHGYRTCVNQPDGWHQYGPGAAASAQDHYSYSISPGFWHVGQDQQLDRDPARWKTNIRAMINSGATFQLITTFNEWGEGTAVEPALEWASLSGYGSYLDALHNNGRDYVFLPIVRQIP